MGEQEFKARVENYTAVSCFAASTGHKTQGRTLTDGVVMGPPYNASKYNNDGWVYVVLSRVATSAKAYLMEPLSTNLDNYKERKKIKTEMARLRKVLFEPTLRTLGADDIGSNNGRRRLTYAELRASSGSGNNPLLAKGMSRRLTFAELRLGGEGGAPEGKSRRLTFGEIRFAEVPESEKRSPVQPVVAMKKRRMTFSELGLSRKRRMTFSELGLSRRE